METKANYIATGVFTLAVIVGAFGFIFWFQNTGGSAAQATYRVVFDGSVSGLRTGAAVLFNGIRVGEVAELALDAARPAQGRGADHARPRRAGARRHQSRPAVPRPDRTCRSVAHRRLGRRGAAHRRRRHSRRRFMPMPARPPT